MDYTEYKIGTSGAWTVYTESIEIVEEGLTIYARSVDKAGNAGDEAELEVKIDRTPPSRSTIELAGPSAPSAVDSWYLGPITVSIAEGTDVLSGTDYVEYKIDNGDWTKFTLPFTIGEAYKTTIYTRSRDKVGNSGPEEIRTVTITSKRPSMPSSGVVAPGQGNRNITLLAGSEGSIELNQAIFISIPAGATDKLLEFSLEQVEGNHQFQQN